VGKKWARQGSLRGDVWAGPVFSFVKVDGAQEEKAPRGLFRIRESSRPPLSQSNKAESMLEA